MITICDLKEISLLVDADNISPIPSHHQRLNRCDNQTHNLIYSIISERRESRNLFYIGNNLTNYMKIVKLKQEKLKHIKIR